MNIYYVSDIFDIFTLSQNSEDQLQNLSYLCSQMFVYFSPPPPPPPPALSLSHSPDLYMCACVSVFLFFCVRVGCVYVCVCVCVCVCFSLCVYVRLRALTVNTRYVHFQESPPPLLKLQRQHQLRRQREQHVSQCILFSAFVRVVREFYVVFCQSRGM